jgi:hypothetical protein
MKISISKTVNEISYLFEVETEKEIDALAQAASYASMPEKCGVCDSTDIHLSTNKAGGFTFVKMICGACNSRANIGQYKEGGIFWKTWEKYTPKSKDE